VQGLETFGLEARDVSSPYSEYTSRFIAKGGADVQPFPASQPVGSRGSAPLTLALILS